MASGFFKSFPEILNRAEIDLNNGKSALRISGSVTSGGVAQSYYETKDLSTGSLSYDIPVSSSYIIKTIMFSFDAPVSETITISLSNPTLGIEIPLLTQTLSSNSSMIASPLQNYTVYTDEVIKITCTNTGLTSNLTVVANVEVL